MPCVFCGASKTSNEHVLPKWMREFLGAHASKPHYLARTHQGQSAPPSTWNGIPFDHQVGCVCAPCNNNWMSALEGRARPYLETLLNGNHRTFYAGGQQTLATWAAKTAVILGCIAGTGNVPASHYKALHSNPGEPPPNTQVYLAAKDDPGDQIVYEFTSFASESAAGAPDSYTAILGVAELAFQVYGRDNEDMAPGEPYGLFQDAFRQVWPLTGQTVIWPPPIRLAYGNPDTYPN